MRYKKEILGNFIDVESGYAFKSKDFTSSGIPVIKIKNIKPPFVSLDDVDYVPQDFESEYERFRINYNDILIAMTGSHINQWESVVGRVARVKFDKSTLLNQRVGRIVLKENCNADIGYIYYFLSQDKIKIELSSKAGGAANQANINSSHIKQLELPIPCVEVQSKIASILSAYDDLIENNQKQIKLLEEAAQRLYKEWFIDLRFPGHEDVKIVDGVPEGWKKVKVAEVIKVVKKSRKVKTSEYKEVGKIPIIDQGDKFIGGFTDDESCLIKIDEPIVVFGDHTRRLKLIQFDFASGADGTQLIESVTNCMPIRLLYCSLVNVDLSNYHYARHYKYLKEELVILPVLNIACLFENLAKDIFENVQLCRAKITALQEARDRLLPKLMSGEIEV